MFRTYLLAQLKRSLKLFPALMAAAAVLACCLGLMAAALLQADAAQEKKQMVRVGLVGSTEGSYLGFGIHALQSLDSSRFAVEFTETESEEAARKSLERGELSAYLLIPDGFVEAVVQGRNMQVTYVASAGAAGIGNMVMSELADTVSGLITHSQSAIYGTQNLLRGQAGYREASDRLYLRLLDFILGRELIYEIELTGVSGGLSLPEYYFCGMVILFLMLWGIAAAPLYMNRNAAVSKLLQAKGLSAGRQVLAEYFTYVVFLFCSFFMAVVLLGAVAVLLAASASDFGVSANFSPAISAGEIFTVNRLGLLFGMFPVVLLFAAMQLWVREWISAPVVCSLIQFLGILCLGYLSGCFYPITFFPAEIQFLAQYLPTGAAMEYSGRLMLGEPAPGALAVMGAYGAGCFWAAVFLRKRGCAK